VVTLIWNGMGVMNYFMQMNADLIASFPESHRAIIESRPAWVTGGFAVAVFGGTLGCILLLLKKSVVYYVFIVSLLGVMVTMSHALGISRSIFDFSLFEMFMMILMPMVVAVFLIWYSKWAERKGWIS
jgi:hypothetical protein